MSKQALIKLHERYMIDLDNEIISDISFKDYCKDFIEIKNTDIFDNYIDMLNKTSDSEFYVIKYDNGTNGVIINIT